MSVNLGLRTKTKMISDRINHLGMEKGFHQFVSMGRTFHHSKGEYNDWVEQETIFTFLSLILKF